MIEPVQSIVTPPDTSDVSAARAVQPVTAVAPQSKDDSQAKTPEKTPQAVPDPAPVESPLAIEPDFRLVIENNLESSELVYRLVNRTTGNVLYEISRDDVVNLLANPGYQAGAVIDTKA
jgi:hypothetical protein